MERKTDTSVPIDCKFAQIFFAKISLGESFYDTNRPTWAYSYCLVIRMPQKTGRLFIP